MVELFTVFTIAGFIILLGFIGEYIFQKTNIPDVIWLMLFGVGLSFFSDITKSQAFFDLAPIFTTFALIFILFDGALNIEIKKLLDSIVDGSSLSFLNFIFSLLVVPGAMYFAGWDIFEGLLLGAIVGGVSSAVVIPMTKRLHMKPKTALILTLESALSDVLCIVGAITILNIIILKEFSVSLVLQKLLYSFTVAGVVGTLWGLFWVKMHSKMDEFSRNYMTTIGAMLLLYSFVEYIESNGAIACLAFGIVIGNSKKIFSFIDKEKEYKMHNAARSFFSEISFFVKTFFFVYLGMIIDLTNYPLIFLGFLLTLLLLMARSIAVAISNRKHLISQKDQIFMEAISPKGLAAAVLAQLPLQITEPGLIPHAEQFSTVVLSIIMFSILFSTIGVFMTEKGKYHGLKSFIDIRNFKKVVGR